MSKYHIIDFHVSQTKALRDFLAYWLKQHKVNPETFPLEVDEDNSGSFFENYILFLEERADIENDLLCTSDVSVWDATRKA